jgi:hypothetical protein
MGVPPKGPAVIMSHVVNYTNYSSNGSSTWSTYVYALVLRVYVLMDAWRSFRWEARPIFGLHGGIAALVACEDFAPDTVRLDAAYHVCSLSAATANIMTSLGMACLGQGDRSSTAKCTMTTRCSNFLVLNASSSHNNSHHTASEVMFSCVSK